MQITHACGLAGIALVIMNCSYAAEEHVELEQMTINARPISSQSATHITQPVTILSGDELKQQMSNTIGETLATQAGVSASSFGPGASRPIIRGLGGPRLRVLQGGIGALDVSTVSEDHAVSLSPFSAEQIEILRGPATVLYGSGSTAGVINIVNNRIPDELSPFESEVNLRHNTVSNERTIALETDGGRDHIAFHLDLLNLESNNLDAADFEIQNSFVETRDINLGTSWVDDWGFLGISIGKFFSRYGIPLDPGEPEPVSIDLEQFRINISGEIKNPLPGFNQVNLRGAYNDYQHIEFEDPVTPGTTFTNEEFEFTLEAAHNPIAIFSGVTGVNIRHRNFAAVGDEAIVPASNKTTMGLFLFEETDWDRWHFEAALRGDLQEIETANLNTIDHEVFTVSSGIRYELMPDMFVGLNLSRAQRAPTIEELLVNGAHHATGTFEIGDNGLKEETSNNIDLAFNMSGDSWLFKTNVFANYIEDYIYQAFLDTNGDGVVDIVDEDGNLDPTEEFRLIQFQQRDAFLYGLEAEAHYQWMFQSTAMHLKAFGDTVNARLSGGEDIPRITPARIGLRLDTSRGDWTSHISAIHVLEQDQVAQLETETDGYLMLNVGISRAFQFEDAASRIYLRGSNLLDEDARRHTSFLKDRSPLAGRALMSGFELQF